MTNLTQTEIEVLKSIIGGTRIFSQSQEVKAIRKLTDRGYISFEVLQGTQKVTRSYNFGRTVISKTIPDAAVRIFAQKIEAAVAKHGAAIVINSIR
jgi:hypothetical protein